MTTRSVSYNLAGHVRHQGLPVAGIQVCLVEPPLADDSFGARSTAVRKQKTGNRGEFNFAVHPGQYRLDVEPDSNTRFLRQSVTVTVGATNTSCSVGLTTGVILSGQVVTESGAMLSNGEVVALGIEPTSYRSSALVTEDARYTIVLRRGRYHIAYRSTLNDGDENEQRSVDRSYSLMSGAVAVVDVDGDQSFDLILPEFATLTGEVTDIFGNPVPFATVTATPAQSHIRLLAEELELNITCLTDDAGRFKIEVQSGLYHLSIQPEPMSLLFGVEVSNLLIAGDLSQKFQLPEGFRLRGQALYAEQPLSQCLVRIQGLESKFELLAKTDPRGEFSVGIPSGSYKVVITAHPKDSTSVTINDAEYNALAPWTRLISVGGDAHVEAHLQQGTALYGRILDENGEVKSGVRVAVFADSMHGPSREGADRSLSSGITDGEGKYCIFLSPGTYWLAVHTDLANAARVDIEAEPVKLDITWHGWCQLRLEVTGQDGRPIPRCRVSYAPYGSDESDEEYLLPGQDLTRLSRGYLLTGDDGACQVTIPAGVYTIRLTPPPHSSYEAKIIRQFSVNTDSLRAVRLPLKEALLEDQV